VTLRPTPTRPSSAGTGGAGPARADRVAPVLLMALLLVVVVASPPRAADATVSTERMPGPDAEALRLLERAVEAARTVGYTGVQFLSTWAPGGTSSVVVDVDHVPSVGTSVEVRAGSGAPSGAAFTVSPDDDTEARAAAVQTTVGDVSARELDLLRRNFDLVVEGRDHVAGREASVVTARRGGASAGRFWVDVRSGLLLRREVYDSQGTVVRASAFIDLRPARQEFVHPLPPPMPTPLGHDAQAAGREELDADGWTCPAAMAGSLSLREARRLTADDREVVHLSYSDGLSSVSVFEQRGHLDVERLGDLHTTTVGDSTVYVDQRPPQRYLWSAHGTVYTVITDAPAETAAQVVAALPHEAEDNGVTSRIQRGMGRVASWFNPFA
jgi:sigma-E factor negative regulatory protein RseB